MDVEQAFVAALYQKYEACPKKMIPKEKYYETIETIKAAKQKSSGRTRQEHSDS